MRTAQTNQHLPNGIKRLTPEELIQHAYCVEVAGYTILRNQVPLTDIQTYREVCTRVLDNGANGRCLYCWGTETLKILEHGNIDQLATRVMGEYKFWDLMCVCARPATEGVQYPPKVEYPPMNDLGWHRDFGRASSAEEQPVYMLYFFVCLVDINDENGATWIVPGSHRRSARHEPLAFKDEEKWVASAIQVRANAGDIVVLSPSTFHAPGWNYTNEPRLIMSVGLVSQREPARYNHWQIAAPIRERLTGRVERLLKASETHYEKDPELPPPDLPEGWPALKWNRAKNSWLPELEPPDLPEGWPLSPPI